MSTASPLEVRPTVPAGRINVMHLVLSLEVGGLERMVVEHATGLDSDIFNVEVCCCDRTGALARQLEHKGITVTLVRKNQERFDWLYPLRLRKFLIKKNVTILHIHSGILFLGAMAGLLAGVPAMVYTDHGRHLVDPLRLILMERFAGRFIDRIVAVSSELEHYLREVVRLPSGKTGTIINGIDTARFRRRSRPTRLLDELGIGADAPVIGTVGRLAPVKDQATMIEAFAMIRERIPTAVLVITGDGPLNESLREKATAMHIGENVIFTGDRDDVDMVLNLFDLFVLTSLSEGTSVSLLEAMASGVAPLVTNVGGNPSIVDGRTNGILVSPGDVGGIANRIITLLEDSAARERIAQNAAETVRSRYSKESMMEHYREIYLELASPGQTGIRAA